MKSIYLIGSLRNPAIPEIGNKLRDIGYDVFDAWWSASEDADDWWQRHEQLKGNSYKEALKGRAARHVFSFDRDNLTRCGVGLLVLPAGKSAHLELGYIIGQGKPGYVLFDSKTLEGNLPNDWRWLAGLYEGEGTVTRNNSNPKAHGLQLSITMKDEDIIRRAQSVAVVGKVEGPFKRNNPKWSDMWRWSVRRREQLLYVLHSLWEELGTRRKAQAIKAITNAGLQEAQLFNAPTVKQFRWDVMYNFCKDVFFSEEEMLNGLKQD